MSDGINLKMKVTGADKVQRELKQTGTASKKMGTGVNSATRAMKSMGIAINPVTAGLAAATAGLVAAALAAKVAKDAFVGTIKSTVKLADDLDVLTKKAQSLGTSNRDLQLMINSMALFGLETGATIKSIQKFQIKLGEAMLPTAPKMLKEVFDRLGVSAEDLAKMPMRERFIATANALTSYGDRFTMAADAQQLFGRGSKEMLAVFSRGGKAISDAMDDVERYGLASDEAFANSERLVDAQHRLKLAFLGLRIEALTPIMPVLEDIAQQMADSLADFDGNKLEDFGEAFGDLIEGIIHGIAAIGPALELVAKGLKVIAFAGGVIARTELRKLNFVIEAVQKATPGESSVQRWKDWGDEAVESIQKVRMAAAEGPMLGPELPTLGPDLPPGFKPSAPSAPGTPKGKAKPKKAATDPFAGLRRDVEAFQGSLMTKEEALKQSLMERQAMLSQAHDANLIDTDRWLDLDRAAQLQYYAALDEMTESRFEKERALREQAAAERDRLREEDLQKLEAYKVAQMEASKAVFDAVGSLAGSISQMITDTMGEQSEEAKKAAKVLFGVQQASALASATVSMAAAIGQANASAPPPFNVPAIIQASVTGAAQLAAITAATISGVADAGLPPGALKRAGLNNHTMLAVRNDEMVLDPVGTAAISRMLEQRAPGGGQPIMVNASVEIDGEVLGRTVDNHLVRSSERGLGYQRRIRY